MKNWFKKSWEWLDDKKTVIGGAMVWTSTLLKPHTLAYGILYYGGTLLGGVGVAHKSIKGELGTLPSGVKSVTTKVNEVSKNMMNKMMSII